MRRLRLALQVTAGVAASVCLAGCISVFPKEAPAQLYRFGASFRSAGPTPSAASNSVAVLAMATSFDRPAGGDAILTVTGEQVAYIKGARWAAPATTLFDAAVARAFNSERGAARLIPSGELTRPDLLMKLDVRAFEARYETGAGSAPIIVVELYAALTRASDRTLASERVFEARVPASENRAGAIAEAFDKASSQVLGELVAWVDKRGAA